MLNDEHRDRQEAILPLDVLNFRRTFVRQKREEQDLSILCENMWFVSVI